MPKQSIKLVHTSDVHLDGRFASEDAGDYRNQAERVFAAVVDTVLDEDADIFLVAGDLFDNARVGEADFEYLYTQLQRVACPVFMIPGNHDVHDERSLWNRVDVAQAGNHVHAFLDHAGSSVLLDDLGVRCWGKAMHEHSNDYEPLGNTPARDDSVWNIGMAHGDTVKERAGLGASQITHNEIRDSGFDYLALGHIHVWGDMSQGDTTACYPGSPVAAYASANKGHVAIAEFAPDTGVTLTQRLVDGGQKAKAAFVPGVF